MKRWIILLTAAALAGSCASVRPGPTLTYLPQPGEYINIDDAYAAGLDYLREGDPQAAIDSFRRSAVRDEYLFIAYGYAYLSKEEYEIARRNFEKALAINPDNKDARIGMQLLSEPDASREELLQAYSRLGAQYPGDRWIQQRVEEIRQEGREHYLKQAEKVRGDEDRQEEYIQHLKQAEVFGGRSDPINLQIARFYRDQNDLPAATRYLEKYVMANEGDVQAMRELARLYERLEKYDQSLLVYRKIQALQPDQLEWQDRINEIKTLLYESDLPQKFKNIFFKESLTREDLAALVGHYFQDFLMIEGTPVIISDIGDSYARNQIILVCSNGIMQLKPDHSFDLYREVGRADFCTILNSLMRYLETRGYRLNLKVQRDLLRPVDVSAEHRSYSTILLLINLGIMDLDSQGRFNPTLSVKPYEAMAALKKILHEINR